MPIVDSEGHEVSPDLFINAFREALDSDPEIVALSGMYGIGPEQNNFQERAAEIIIKLDRDGKYRTDNPALGLNPSWSVVDGDGNYVTARIIGIGPQLMVFEGRRSPR